MAEGLSSLYQIQGVSLPPRPIFHGANTAASTEELPEDDDDDADIATDTNAPMDD